MRGEPTITLTLVNAVAQARTPEVQAAVRAVYTELDSEIAIRKPRCDASGRCCHFEAYGHRLYVTTAELATFIDEAPVLPKKALLPLAGACPLLAGGLCSVHAIRPFGCRIFFCDATADDWMKDAYERHLLTLKSIHDRFAIPYHYLEWRQALAELGFAL